MGQCIANKSQASRLHKYVQPDTPWYLSNGYSHLPCSGREILHFSCNGKRFESLTLKITVKDVDNLDENWLAKVPCQSYVWFMCTNMYKYAKISTSRSECSKKQKNNCSWYTTEHFVIGKRTYILPTSKLTIPLKWCKIRACTCPLTLDTSLVFARWFYCT